MAYAAASGSNGTNLALGKPVTALTNTVVGQVSSLTDGQYNTWYSYTADAGGYHAMFTLDLGATYSIGKLNFAAVNGDLPLRHPLEAWNPDRVLLALTA